MPQTFKTYTIRILGPDPREDQPARAFDRERGDVSEILRGRVFSDVEDILNDALPEGWDVRISEWDK